MPPSNTSDDVPDRPYLLNEVLGLRMRKSRMENGDFVFKTDLVRKGFFQGVRSLPPLAPADIPRMGDMATRQYGHNPAR